MENNKITLSVGQMRQIAQHEITFRDILGNDTFDDGAISCPDTYNFTLDDLHQAIKRLSAANPTILEFGEYWFYPITLLSEAFCLDRACGWESDSDDVPQSMKEYPGLIVSDSSFISSFISAFLLTQINKRIHQLYRIEQQEHTSRHKLLF